MPRTKGATNKDSEQRKLSILTRIWAYMRQHKNKPISWREMATAGEVGLATLSHHFGKRDDVVKAILQSKRIEGEEALAILAKPAGNFDTSIRQALEHLLLGLVDYDVGDLVSLGLLEGINHESIGPVFVEEGLEPIIQAAIQRLKSHQEREEMRSDVDLRIAAISLISPLIIAYLHQTNLGGKEAHPLDLQAIVEQTCDTFVRAYSIPTKDAANTT